MVVIDIPSAEVGSADQEQSATDLANPGPVETKEISTESSKYPLEEWSSEVLAVKSAFEAALTKWEQDCQEATKQHAIWIEQTKEQMIGLDKKISTTAEQLKSLKDQKKGAVERLIQLEVNGPEFPTKPTEEAVRATIKSKQSSSASATSAGSTNGSPTQSTAAEVNTDDSWRLVPTVKILEGIERLGQKKMDSIVDTFPTLGDLEDIRGEASKEHVHFADKLPDGIGKTIADKIEERMMDEIAKYSLDAETQKAVLEEAIEKADDIIDEGEPEYEDADDSEDVDLDDI